MHRSIVGVACLSGALALLGDVAQGQVIGSGSAIGHDRLRVKGCGKSKVPATLSFTLFADGTWSAVDEQGYDFSGFHTAVSDKKFTLLFDDDSEARFVGILETAASALCEQGVTVTGAVAKRFFLKRNRKRSKATVRLKYGFTGTAAGQPGRAKYVLKVGGPYAAVP